MKKLSVVLIAIATMTLSLSAQAPAYLNTDLSVEERVNDLVSRMTVEEKAAQLLIHRSGHPASGCA